MNWFKKIKLNKDLRKRPIAYFCAEYALFDHPPLYTGGLGVLAGDFINEIVDEGLPVVAIGLFYHKNDVHGTELSDERKTATDLGLTLTKNSDGSVLKIPIKIGDRTIYIQAWTWKKSNMNIYLLDTQLEENTIADWEITDLLYANDRYLRLMQEVVMGIGGIKLIKALNINPSVYHMNEGHSAFLAFELIKNQVNCKKVDFKMACDNTKASIVFTNHTLVAAGHELFAMDMMREVFSDFAKNFGASIEDLLNLGVENGSDMFSMTTLALNMSYKVNAVSVLHAKKANEEWQSYKVESVTNGIYLNRWDSLKHYSHKENKLKLIKLIKDKSGVSFDENILLIGWARRFVDYKRPLAIFENIDRLKKIATAEGREVRIVYSSIVNSTYTEENEYIKKIYSLMEGELKDIVAFIPNYDIEVSRVMTAGCDIWLNTPIVGREACGTSGMKACLNGALPLTTSDGWVDEVDMSNIGWVVGNDFINKWLLNTIERHIVTEYYTNKSAWDKRVRLARQLIVDKFSTKRMLNEYLEKMYIPTIDSRSPKSK